MTRAGGCLLAVLGLALAASAPAQENWRTFEGSWSATVRRDTLPTEGEREAAIIHLSGAVVLTSGEGLSRGFRGEAIGFDDGQNIRVGRSVWTDDRGERIFAALEGEALATGRRTVGRVTGGTGRYEGLTGEFTLTWQYVVQAEDGTVQVRTTDLKGRYLPRSAAQ